jgi:hypothetical protein
VEAKGLRTATVEVLRRAKKAHHSSRGAARWTEERERSKMYKKKEKEFNTPKGDLAIQQRKSWTRHSLRMRYS